MAGIDDKANFVSWLGGVGTVDSSYVLTRHSNGLLTSGKPSNMSGHFHSGFFGIRDFLRSSPQYQGAFRNLVWSTGFWKSNQQLEHDFALFVQTHWAKFPGQKGGDWRKKLPLSLGGLPAKAGGRGSGLISRMFILLDQYGHHVGY